MSRICSAAVIVAVLVAGCADSADTFCPTYSDLMVRVQKGTLTPERADQVLATHTNQCTKCQAREAENQLLKEVRAALGLYHDDMGRFPTEELGGLRALWIKPSFVDENLAKRWEGPYMQEPREGWAKKVHYQAVSHGISYKLWSGPMTTPEALE